jgi:hypothetical protein
VKIMLNVKFLDKPAYKFYGKEELEYRIKNGLRTKPYFITLPVEAITLINVHEWIIRNGGDDCVPFKCPTPDKDGIITFPALSVIFTDRSIYKQYYYWEYILTDGYHRLGFLIKKGINKIRVAVYRTNF